MILEPRTEQGKLIRYYGNALLLSLWRHDITTVTLREGSEILTPERGDPSFEVELSRTDMRELRSLWQLVKLYLDFEEVQK
jgi:hypothetical protein